MTATTETTESGIEVPVGTAFQQRDDGLWVPKPEGEFEAIQFGLRRGQAFNIDRPHEDLEKVAGEVAELLSKPAERFAYLTYRDAIYGKDLLFTRLGASEITIIQPIWVDREGAKRDQVLRRADNLGMNRAQRRAIEHGGKRK